MSNTGWNKVEFLDSKDLGKYSWHQGYFKHEWNPKLWKRNFRELKLRDVSLFPLGEIAGKKILDIGCGAEGLYMLTFLKMGASYVAGQDILTASVKTSIALCTENGFNCDAKVGDCTHLAFEDNTFDYVFSGDVFEHITEEQKNKCLAEIYRVLKPGGLVTIKTPNRSYLKASIFLKRISAVLKFKNPFTIHIAHTKNNPDNEHHGLTTHHDLRNLFLENMFHEPTTTFYKLERTGISEWVSTRFEKNLYFNEHIIMTAKKPIFYGLYK